MKEAAVYQFAGASSLFLPVLLAFLVTEQRWLAAPPRKLLARAFVIGFAASFAAQLLRIATLDPSGYGLAANLGAALAGDALKLGSIAAIVLLFRAFSRVESAAAAGACALGFGVGYGLDLTVLMLDAAVKVALLLTVSSPAVSAAFSALVGKHVEVRAALPAADHYYLLVADLLPAAIMGWAVARGARVGRWGVSLAAIITALGLSLTLAWAFQSHPLLETLGRRPIPFYEVAADPGALALVAAPLLGLVGWLYLMVWRPERRGSIAAESAAAPEGAGAPPRRIARTGAVAVAAVAISAAGLGAWMAFIAPPALREYRDPEGLFAIEVPRRWQVQARPGAETRFFADDPIDGALVSVHPWIDLPPGSTVDQLVGALEGQMRKMYQDVEAVPHPFPPRVEGGRSIEAIELELTWTRPGKAASATGARWPSSPSRANRGALTSPASFRNGRPPRWRRCSGG